ACIKAAIDAAGPDKRRQLYVVHLTLQGFKEINGAFGHRVGDDLLRTIAGRLVRVAGSRAEVGRASGDEFALIFEADAPGDSIQAFVRELLDELRRPVELEHNKMQVGTSIGIAEYPGAGGDPETLLRHAGHAMRRAEQDGSGFAFFDAS